MSQAEFLPETAIERAYVQAISWTMAELIRRVRIESQSSRSDLVVGYLVALLAHYVESNDHQNLKESLSRLYKICVTLDERSKTSCVKIIADVWRRVHRSMGQKIDLIDEKELRNVFLSICEQITNSGEKLRALAALEGLKQKRMASKAGIPSLTELRSISTEDGSILLELWEQQTSNGEFEDSDSTLQQLAASLTHGEFWSHALAELCQYYVRKNNDLYLHTLLDALFVELEAGETWDVELSHRISHLARNLVSARRDSDALNLLGIVIKWNRLEGNFDNSFQADVHAYLLVADRLGETYSALQLISDIVTTKNQQPKYPTQLSNFRSLHQELSEKQIAFHRVIGLSEKLRARSSDVDNAAVRDYFINVLDLINAYHVAGFKLSAARLYPDLLQTAAKINYELDDVIEVTTEIFNCIHFIYSYDENSLRDLVRPLVLEVLKSDCNMRVDPGTYLAVLPRQTMLLESAALIAEIIAALKTRLGDETPVVLPLIQRQAEIAAESRSVNQTVILYRNATDIRPDRIKQMLHDPSAARHYADLLNSAMVSSHKLNLQSDTQNYREKLFDHLECVHHLSVKENILQKLWGFYLPVLREPPLIDTDDLMSATLAFPSGDQLLVEQCSKFADGMYPEARMQILETIMSARRKFPNSETVQVQLQYCSDYQVLRKHLECRSFEEFAKTWVALVQIIPNDSFWTERLAQAVTAISKDVVNDAEGNFIADCISCWIPAVNSQTFDLVRGSIELMMIEALTRGQRDVYDRIFAAFESLRKS